MDKITRLTVGNKNITANNNYHNTSGKVCEILLSRTRHEIPANYYSINDLSNTGKIEVFKEGTGKMFIDEEILDNLSKYFSEESSFIGNNFDCVDFSHYLLGYKYNGNPINSYYYDFIKFSESELKVGDIIMTTNSKGNIEYDSHLMVYIGGGLYISKFGSKGRVIITSLDEYNNIYPYDTINIIRPKF